MEETYKTILLKNVQPSQATISDNVSSDQILYKKLLMTHPNITLTDSLDGLENYSFKECDNETCQIIKASRGIVYSGEKMICRSFPFTVSFTTDQKADIIKFFGDLDISQVMFFPCFEGTIVRVFNHNDKWYISTNRRLNADDCNWGPDRETFGSKFRAKFCKEREEWDPSTDPFSILDKQKTYFFLIENNMKSRLVCQKEFPQLYFVGGIFQDKFFTEPPRRVLTPPLILFKTYDQVIDYAEKTDWKKQQGIIAFCPGFIQVKIISTEYNKRYLARNNNPHLGNRYLELRGKNDNVKLNLFMEMYPEHSNEFFGYEKKIQIVSQKLLALHDARYLSKQFVKTTPQKHFVMKTAWEESGFGKEKVGIEEIKEILLRQNTRTIQTMIREMVPMEIKEIVFVGNNGK